jgi:prepilin-type N-terminal cleavage/methylation domain-containing protein
MRTGERFRKRGFTLVETVVTVGIIAALAAVVYPTVVKQLDSADPTRLAEDLGNIRTGLETFGVNVRPQLPGDIEDLINRPDGAAGADRTSLRVAYSDVEAASWNGPYLGISIPTTFNQSPDTAVTTGFSAKIINRMPLYDLDETTVATLSGDTVLTASATSTAEFVAVRIVGLSGPAFNAANLLIDGPTENDVTKRRSQGRLRCPQATYTTDAAVCTNAYYLAVPTR